ncbi:MAG TPA: hypothetical protein VGC77_05335 [Rhodopseudomonas sp.]|uniref:hypothetical protein n=1 Tax=Rhodopseudomonas sp. TaxID=1078 RepID=UPI002ED9D839
MTATSNKIEQQQPGAVEALLPWYAAGTLGARDTQMVEAALASDPELARQLAAIQDECAATIRIDESLGVPSRRALEKLFAAIDAEPGPAALLRRRLAMLGERPGSPSPGLPGWTALVGTLALLLQAGIIAALLLGREPAHGAPATAVPRAAATQALVQFAPAARIAEIGPLLEAYQATIVESSQGGVFRLHFAGPPLPRAALDDVLARLRSEAIVSLAVAAP